jgi:hypothetical protein
VNESNTWFSTCSHRFTLPQYFDFPSPLIPVYRLTQSRRLRSISHPSTAQVGENISVMPSNKTKHKVTVKEGGEATFTLLKLTIAAADAFPPLKSAAGGALHIIDLVKVCLTRLTIRPILTVS